MTTQHAPTAAAIEARAREAWSRLPGGRPEPDPDDLARTVEALGDLGTFDLIADGVAFVAGSTLPALAAALAAARVRALVESDDWRRDYALDALSRAAAAALDRLEADAGANLAAWEPEAFRLGFEARYYDAAGMEAALEATSRAHVYALGEEIARAMGES